MSDLQVAAPRWSKSVAVLVEALPALMSLEQKLKLFGLVKQSKNPQSFSRAWEEQIQHSAGSVWQSEVKVNSSSTSYFCLISFAANPQAFCFLSAHLWPHPTVMSHIIYWTHRWVQLWTFLYIDLIVSLFNSCTLWFDINPENSRLSLIFFQLVKIICSR